LGREMGHQVLENYLETKTVVVGPVTAPSTSHRSAEWRRARSQPTSGPPIFHLCSAKNQTCSPRRGRASPMSSSLVARTLEVGHVASEATQTTAVLEGGRRRASPLRRILLDGELDGVLRFAGDANPDVADGLEEAVHGLVAATEANVDEDQRLVRGTPARKVLSAGNRGTPR